MSVTENLGYLLREYGYGEAPWNDTARQQGRVIEERDVPECPYYQTLTKYAKLAGIELKDREIFCGVACTSKRDIPVATCALMVEQIRRRLLLAQQPLLPNINPNFEQEREEVICSLHKLSKVASDLGTALSNGFTALNELQQITGRNNPGGGWLKLAENCPLSPNWSNDAHTGVSAERQLELV